MNTVINITEKRKEKKKNFLKEFVKKILPRSPLPKSKTNRPIIKYGENKDSLSRRPILSVSTFQKESRTTYIVG